VVRQYYSLAGIGCSWEPLRDYALTKTPLGEGGGVAAVDTHVALWGEWVAFGDAADPQ